MREIEKGPTFAVSPERLTLTIQSLQDVRARELDRDERVFAAAAKEVAPED